MKRLTRLAIARPLLTVLLSVGLFGGSAVGGLQVFSKMQSQGYSDPNSESARVTTALRETFDTSTPPLTVIADFPQSVDSDASRTQAEKLTADLANIDGVSEVSSYFSLGAQDSLKSTDGTAAYFFVRYDASADKSEQTQLITDTLGSQADGVKLYYLGQWVMANALNESISHDIGAAESIAIPLSVVLLLFVFGSLVAAGLPLFVGALSMVGALFFVWLASLATDVSIFSVNLLTGLALGLGIDYSLLIVNRFREERAAGHPVREAVLQTMQSAGRTVLFSGLTVALVLASLLMFPMYFLRSMGIAGVAVVFVALLLSLVALPALLALLGDRVDRFRLLRRSLAPRDTGLWATVSRFVMRRSLPVLIVSLLGVGGLVALGGHSGFGLVDERVLPATSPAAQAGAMSRDRFDGQEAAPIQIIATGATDEQLRDYVTELSQLDHIVRVQSALGLTQDGSTEERAAAAFTDYVRGDEQRIVVIGDVIARSAEGSDLVGAIRAIEPAFDVQVGGTAADYRDTIGAVTDRLPILLLWVFVATMVLLWLFTGSVLLPLKAFVLNVLTLAATFGFLSWIFVDGSLAPLMGNFTPMDNIELSMFILIAVVTYGLSMDYELFLLGRIKELHDQGRSTEESVALGLQRSGRIITAAALILAANFLPMLSSTVVTVKMLGLGIGFAILFDATVIRGLLVPALMKLLGRVNWWQPRWLARVHGVVGLQD